MVLHIALVMMVKNETKRIQVTLDSVKGIVNSVVIYDTGSTDNTIEIIESFCIKNKLPLRLKHGEFVNFSLSRNVCLDFAETFPEIDYFLLLDCNDELRKGKELRVFAEHYKNHESTGFLVCQEWWSGQYEKYYNMRFLKSRKGWRYRGSVHEWLKNSTEPEPPVVRIPEEIVIYQDRTQDDDKSYHRFHRDKVLLEKEYAEDPTEPRMLFYLGQTCACCNDIEGAYYYYKLRTMQEGFQEEKFHSYMRTGDMAAQLGHDWSDVMGWYMKAFEHSKRAEPLYFIGEHYRLKSQWLLSYTFASLACTLDYPSESILFVDKLCYEFKRWYLMSIVAYYAGFYKEGKEACYKALKSGVNKEGVEYNLKFYEKYEETNKKK